MWARDPERNYYWDSDTCSFATENGNLEMLKWGKIKRFCKLNGIVIHVVQLFVMGDNKRL
jgi:hypothetical protein